MTAADIPPSPPAAPPAPAPAAARTAEVTAGPPDIAKQPQTTLQGRVVSSGQELRIATDAGEIVLKTIARYPPDTPVTVTVTQQRAKLIATVTVEQVKADMLREVAAPPTPQITPVKTDAPPPPLRPGVEALLLRLPPAPPVLLPQLPPAEVADIIRGAPPEILKPLLAQLPETGKALLPLLARPALIAPFLAALPPAKMEEVIRLLVGAKLAAPAAPPAASLPVAEDIARIGLSSTLLQTLLQPSGDTPQGNAMPPSLMKAAAPVIAALKSGMITTVEAEAALRNLGLGKMPEQPPLFRAQIVSVTPPQGKAPIQTPAATPAAPVLTATVTRLSPAGFPVIDIGGESFVIRASAPPPLGSQITLEPLPQTPLPPQIQEVLPPAVRATAFDPFFSPVWPALQDALKTIGSTAPDIAATLRETLPAPQGARFTPATLFFIAALQLGIAENWLGDKTMNALRQAGRRDLIEKLGGDFSRLSAASRETLAGDWRMIALPMLHDDQLSQIQLFLRQQQDDDEGGAEEKKTTRFVLNFALSRMGNMQLDGLLQKERLDIVLRTENRLPESLRREMMQKFAAALKQTGLQGAVAFQTRAEYWISISPPSGADFLG